MSKFLQNIFSIKNNGKHIVVTILGINFKFYSETSCRILAFENTIENLNKTIEKQNQKINSLKSSVVSSCLFCTGRNKILLISNAIGGGTVTYTDNYIESIRADKTIIYVKYNSEADIYIINLIFCDKLNFITDFFNMSLFLL